MFGADDFGQTWDLGPAIIDTRSDFMGADAGSLDMLGADEDFLGGAAGDEDALRDADDAANDMLFGAAYDDDMTFAGKQTRAERKLAKAEDRLAELQNRLRSVSGSGPLARMRRNSLNRRIDRKRNKISELKMKVARANGERKQAVAAGMRPAAAIAGVGVAGAAGLAAGSVLASRQAQTDGRPPAALMSPQQAQQLRQLQAAGGLRYSAVGGAGSGRLNKLQMYEASATNPRNALTISATTLSTTATLYSEDLPFAKVRIVGFTCSLYGSNDSAGAIGLVKDLKIKGGANLFIHENWGNADDYNTDDDQLRGLRDNPTITSPNKAQVDINASGDENDEIVMTCAVVVDVLNDDVYGVGFPGPYSG
jgi:hypothetical protein